MGKGRKVALLVGVGTCGDGLKPLQCPANGVTELQGILLDTAIGGFDEVVPLLDPDVGTMRSRIGEVFGRLTKHDLVLFYFTGHGIKDMSGEFYLTTAQTQLFENGRLNPGTAVEASFVKTVLANCYAQRKVIILDCCFGAAFADGFLTMDDGNMDIEMQLGGEGWVVLTAADARNYALEHEGETLSVYTRYLIEGLKTGVAAPVGQEFISVGHLHEYLRNKVLMAAPTMRPEIFNARRGSDIKLAKVAISDPLLRYRREVEKYVRNAEISVVGRKVLTKLSDQLELKNEDRVQIEEEVLQPYVDRLKHLREYEECYREALRKYGLPLPDDVRQELHELQKILNLREQDINESQAIVSKLISRIDDTLASATTFQRGNHQNTEEKSRSAKTKISLSRTTGNNKKNVWRNPLVIGSAGLACVSLLTSSRVHPSYAMSNNAYR